MSSDLDEVGKALFDGKVRASILFFLLEFSTIAYSPSNHMNTLLDCSGCRFHPYGSKGAFLASSHWALM
jgi:hypothetical protein